MYISNLKISAIAFVFAAFGLIGCSGDNSTLFPESENQPAAGSAGAGGGSNVQPPSTGGSGGSAGETFNPPTGGAGGSNSTGGAAGASNTGGASNVGGSSGSASTGGSAGSGGSEVIPPDAGAAGTGGSTSTGGSGGSTSTGGSAGSGSTGGSAGSGGGSVVIPPDAGADAAGGSTSTGGSAGSGGSEVIPPDAGAAGTGGSTSTGGSAGSGSTGGSAGSGGSTGAGELELTIVPATSGTHTIKAYIQTLAYLPGEPNWNTEHSATATRLTFTVAAFAGSSFVFNGYYDPEVGKDIWMKSFCDKTNMKPTVAIMAKFNGQPIGAPTVIDNGSNGCNLTLTAVPLAASANDHDGDGEPDGQGFDCDDNDAFVHHGAIETPDDQVDYDCDGSINPLHVKYRLAIGQTSYVPTFYDWTHGGKTYSMAWNANGYYELGIEKPIAAKEFVIQYSPTNWSVGMVNGGCIKNADVTSYLEQFNTTYTVDMVAYSQYNTCHSVLTNFQP